MSNILEYATSAKALQDIKSALREIGCDTGDVDDITDVAKVIRNQAVSGPQAVINASLASGPGIKITPIDRKGYRISANSGAELKEDINSDLPKGTTIHKALFDIVNRQIPEATIKASQSPAIVGVEVFKAPYDGVDYYDNHAFGRKGQGRKSGLHPDDWYVKIYLYAQVEPLYVSLGPAMEEMKREILSECKHMVDDISREVMDKALAKHIRDFHDSILGPVPHPHHPHKPCPPKPSFNDYDCCDPGFFKPLPPLDKPGYDDDIDPGFSIPPRPLDNPNHPCDICHPRSHKPCPPKPGCDCDKPLPPVQPHSKPPVPGRPDINDDIPGWDGYEPYVNTDNEDWSTMDPDDEENKDFIDGLS